MGEPRRDTRKEHGIEFGETFMFYGTKGQWHEGRRAHLAAGGKYVGGFVVRMDRGDRVHLHPASKFWAAPVATSRPVDGLDKRCDNCAPGYDCESGVYVPVSPYVNVRTSLHVPVHLATRHGDGIAPQMLCGRWAGGAIGPLYVNGVDCVGCVDAYTAILAGRQPDTTSTSHLQRDMSIHA
jgi:hypothetical protein